MSVRESHKTGNGHRGGRGHWTVKARHEWLRAVTKSVRNATAVKVAAELMMRADHSGECFPSSASIADNCGLKERAVRGAIKTLVEAGWIVQALRGGRVSGRAAVVWVAAEFQSRGARA